MEQASGMLTRCRLLNVVELGFVCGTAMIVCGLLRENFVTVLSICGLSCMHACMYVRM